jgi:hypothetical protein
VLDLCNLIPILDAGFRFFKPWFASMWRNRYRGKRFQRLRTKVSWTMMHRDRSEHVFESACDTLQKLLDWTPDWIALVIQKNMSAVLAGCNDLATVLLNMSAVGCSDLAHFLLNAAVGG